MTEDLLLCIQKKRIRLIWAREYFSKVLRADDSKLDSLRSIKGAFVRKSGKGAKEKYVASSVMVVQ